MNLVALLALLAVACRAEQMTKEEQEVLAAATSEDAEDDKEDEQDKEEEPHRPAIHIPAIPSFQIIPELSFPGYHFPPIPLPQLPKLPSFSLPKLPELPKPFKKETIFKTKTVYIEHTHVVTRHPICVTAYVPKPACLYDHDVKEAPQEREVEDDFDPTRKLIQTTTTATVKEFNQPRTRIFEGLSDSESEDVDEALGSELEDQVATYRRARAARNARYLVAHPPRQPAKDEEDRTEKSHEATEPLSEASEKITVSPLEQHLQIPHGYNHIHGQHGPGVGGLYFDGLVNGENHEIIHGLLKETHLVTKTLLVTNVQKVIDTKVTATLLAKNCIPSEHVIPHCKPHHGIFKNQAEPEAMPDPRTGLEEDEDPPESS